MKSMTAKATASEVCDRAVVLRHGLKIAQLDDLAGVTPATGWT